MAEARPGRPLRRECSPDPSRRDPGIVAPAGCVSYTCDADGIRTGKTVGGVTTHFLVDKNRPFAQVLVEHDGAGTVAVSYTNGHDLISQTRDGSTRLYRSDGQISTRRLTGDNTSPTPASVSVTDTYTSDAFGNLLNGSGPTANAYRYTGEQYDSHSGFYYLRARYYAQDVGRFTGRDPFDGVSSDPITLHKYLYVNCNPVNNYDPSGLMTPGELEGSMFVRVLLFAMRHPRVVLAIGLLVNLLIPEEVHDAMIASGISGFTGLGRVGKAEAMFFRLLKPKRMRQLINNAGKGKAGGLLASSGWES